MTATAAPNNLFVNRLAELFGNPESPIPPDPKLEPEHERDSRGQFKNGNRGGPGNPFGRRVAKLRQAMLEECAEEDLRAMTRAMIERAKAGDAAAARLVFQYALGKPAKTVDPDRVDQDEWDVLRSMAVPAPIIQPTLETLPADAANRLVQKLWPVFVQLFANTIRTQAAEIDAAERERKEAEAEWERLSPEEKEQIEAAFRAAALGPNADSLAPAPAKAAHQAAYPAEANPSPNGIFPQTAAPHGDGAPPTPTRPENGAPQRGK